MLPQTNSMMTGFSFLFFIIPAWSIFIHFFLSADESKLGITPKYTFLTNIPITLIIFLQVITFALIIILSVNDQCNNMYDPNAYYEGSVYLILKKYGFFLPLVLTLVFFVSMPYFLLFFAKGIGYLVANNDTINHSSFVLFHNSQTLFSLVDSFVSSQGSLPNEFIVILNSYKYAWMLSLILIAVPVCWFLPVLIYSFETNFENIGCQKYPLEKQKPNTSVPTESATTEQATTEPSTTEPSTTEPARENA